MKVFLNALFVLMIAMSAYLVQGAFFQEFAAKYKKTLERIYPSFLIWPKGEKQLALAYKVASIFSLVLSISGYILLFVSGIL